MGVGEGVTRGWMRDLFPHLSHTFHTPVLHTFPILCTPGTQRFHTFPHFTPDVLPQLAWVVLVVPVGGEEAKVTGGQLRLQHLDGDVTGWGWGVGQEEVKGGQVLVLC